MIELKYELVKSIKEITTEIPKHQNSNKNNHNTELIYLTQHSKTGKKNKKIWCQLHRKHSKMRQKIKHTKYNVNINNKHTKFKLSLSTRILHRPMQNDLRKHWPCMSLNLGLFRSNHEGLYELHVHYTQMLLWPVTKAITNAIRWLSDCPYNWLSGCNSSLRCLMQSFAMKLLFTECKFMQMISILLMNFTSSLVIQSIFRLHRNTFAELFPWQLMQSQESNFR